MNIKVYTDINKLSSKLWDQISENIFFVNYRFLKIFFNNHKNIIHLFVLDGSNRVYGHIFNLNIKNIAHYSSNYMYKYFSNFIIGFLNIKFLYLTNSFITNTKAFYLNDTFNLDKTLERLISKNKIDFIVIPDFLFENKKNTLLNTPFTKVEIEEEMSIEISENWIDFESYKNDLKTKYRKRVNKAFHKSKDVNIRVFSTDELKKYEVQLQNLFNNVTSRAMFKGPTFNVKTFQYLSLISKNFKVYGYFNNDNLIAFSSEFIVDNNLYSYFVGFNYDLNKKFSLYERILCENIINAINNKNNRLILGRTANEFKSNFGAVPKKSYIYININNKLYSFLFKGFLNKIKPKKWIQRFPFKATKS
jgi:hypothetical protein